MIIEVTLILMLISLGGIFIKISDISEDVRNFILKDLHEIREAQKNKR